MGDFQSTQQGIYLRKIMRRKDEIRGYLNSNVTPITDIEVRATPEFERYEDAVKAKGFKPIKVGDVWAQGTNAWFKMHFTVPKEFKGKQVVMCVEIDGEGCAFIDGKPFQGVDPNHREILLTKSAKGGESFEVVIDAISKIWHNPRDRERKILRRADLATRNPEVWEYWFNLKLMHLLAEDLPEDSPRRAKIIYTLNKSVDAFDYTNTDEASLKKSALAANKVLQPLLACKADASATNVAVHGHSHIDVAWLWPYRETKRKCSRTFSTVLRLMEQYPEFIFSQSQAQLYEFTKANYPSVYEEIKQRVKEGRWDVTGSMWVEADCNLCSGESLIRQVLVGKNFYKDEFGIDTDVLWLPDVFGYAAALPQILKKAGVNYFSTIKINWSQLNGFPYTTFYWQGIDGTEILSHFPPTTDYNAFPEPRKLHQQVREFKEKDRSDWSLLSIGWGDGGGGPENRHMEFVRREQDLEGLPRTKFMRTSQFFHLIDGFEDYPKWVGELYLELHRGTYTTQGHNKRFNRQCEFLYRDAELWGSVAAPMGLPYPREELLVNWKDILLNQFHDVIPGSSVREVYEDTDEMYPKIIAFGDGVVASAQQKIAENIDTTGEGQPMVVFNTLPWERSDIQYLEASDAGQCSVLDANGEAVPVQTCGKGRIAFSAAAPSMGYSTYRLVNKAPGKFANEIKVTKNKLENQFYKIELDNKGVIKSLVEKSTGREVLPAGERANLFQLFENKPNDNDAWDIDMFYEDKWDDITDLSGIEVIEAGPVLGAVEMERRFSKSTIKQKMIIYADSPRIDFETWVDWHEDYKVLKTAFPVDVNAAKARYEIQFGNIERPTHTNTSWDVARFEVAAHKWADLSEQDFGVTLMNDCKYGHHTKGNVMRLTLLTSQKDPDYAADMGEHVFTYSLMPHAGTYIEANTVREAYGLNVPMRTALVKPSKGSLPKVKSFFAVDAENVILETVKKAEKEEATILRFYECHNQRASVTVKIDVPFAKVYECDLMEASIAEMKAADGAISFDMKPFEIKTIKLV